MRYPPEWIQKLKEAVSLIEIASENVELKKSGNGQRFMGRCPFHGDRTPSFSVSKDYYHCFGCKASGDAIRFMTDLHGLSFEEACEELAEKIGFPLPAPSESTEVDRVNAAKRKAAATAAKLNHFASLNYFHPNLIGGTQSPLFQLARDYLIKRGITQASIQEFQLGVSSHQHDDLAHFLQKSKAPMEIARNLGIIRPSQKTSGDYDMFRERLIFPLIDARGRMCGFAGRLLTDNKEQPKYLNSPESDLFQKSKFLYGLFQAKKHIREEEVAVVVEGYFDVIGLHQNGFKNAIATCGTSLSEDHVKTLSRLAKKVIVFFDRDEAGINATEKAMELGLKMGQIFYGVPQFTGLDVDEFFISKEAENPKLKVKEAFEQSFALLDQRIDELMKDSEGGAPGQSEKRSQALKKIIQWLQMYTDPLGRAVRANHLARHWGVPGAVLRGLGGGGGVVPMSNQRSITGPTVGSNTPQNAPRKKLVLNQNDRALLSYFLKFEQFGAQFLNVGPKLPEKVSFSALFYDTGLRSWVGQVLESLKNSSNPNQAIEDSLNGDISEELRSVILEQLWKEGAPPEPKHLEDLLNTGMVRIWAQFSQEVRKKMAEAESRQDLENFEKLSKQFLDLQRKLKELEESYVSGKSVE